LLHFVVSSDINMCRCDGYVAVVYSPVVGVVSFRFFVYITAYHPIVWEVSWMIAFYNLVYPCALCHSAHFDAFIFGKRTGIRVWVRTVWVGRRAVDVQADIVWQTVFKNGSYDLLDVWRHQGEICVRRVVTERKCYAWNVLHTSFHTCAHRARIVCVYRAIVAMVDACNNEVRLFAKKLIKSYFHAIDRGA